MENKKIVLTTEKDLLRETVAKKKFTDREEQIQLFDKIFKQQGESEKLIVDFYGVGGIGKSTLCDYFVNLVQSSKEVVSAKINLENKRFQEPVNFLFELRKQLGEHEKKFKFLVFDTSFAYYWSKAYPQIPLKEKTKELPGVFGIIAAIADKFLPVSGVSFAKNLLEFALKKLREIKTKMSVNAEPFLKSMLQLEELKDIEDALPQALSIDIALNLKKAEKRLFIFVDTIEQLWGELSEQLGDQALYQDLWLRETIKHSLIQCQYSIKWFLFGSEKLRWGEVDQGLEQYVEYSLVGQLSKNDCKHYLNEAGIKEENIQKRIIEISQGLPFYLNQAVDLYYSITESQGRVPSVQDFPVGAGNIVREYLKYCNEENALLLKTLAVPLSWNEDLFKYLIKELNIPVSFSTFNSLVKHSFAQQLETGYYTLHQVFREHVYQYFFECDKEDVLSIESLCADFYWKNAKFSTEKELEPNTLYNYEHWLYHTSQVDITKAVKELLNKAKILSKAGHYSFLHRNLLLYVNNKAVSETDYVNLLILLGETEHILGIWNEVLNHFEQALELATKRGWKREELLSLNNIGLLQNSLGRYELALKHFQQALNLAKELGDKSNEAALLNNIALIYSTWGKQTKPWNTTVKLCQ